MKQLSILAFALVAGCSMMKQGGGTSSGGAAAKGPLGDTMADAVPYDRGATITAPAWCHTSGYAKLAIPAGETVTFDVAVTTPKDEACVGIAYLKENGGAGGLMTEVCSSKAQTFEVTAPEGAASFLQLAENGVCQGATVSIAVR